MLLKYFFDSPLAQASWLVGCQRTGEALIVDPRRDVEAYLEAARAHGLKVTAVAETHIHADFVSGARELASRTGARLYFSDCGPAEWKYRYPEPFVPVVDGDVIRVGRVKLEVLHTPGHTPESISLLLTDEGGGADSPMGIFTGDFVFVGSIGRPDLLEKAAGLVGTAEPGARQLFHSVNRFRSLPDHVQVWPAHGAGSACGKGLGAVPSSTVGYEKLFNPALQIHDEQAFVDYILAEQPEAPPYFAVMKRVNKTGPALTAGLPPVPENSPNQLPDLARRELVIDTAPSPEFASAHVPGTVNIPLKNLVQWAGFLVDHAGPVHLILPLDKKDHALRALRSIGIDNVTGVFDADAVARTALRSESFDSLPPASLREKIESGEMALIDVRAQTEWDEGHIAQAEHWFLGDLLRRVGEIPRNRTVVAQCRSGARSSIASSILQRAGLDVINLDGGYLAWQRAGFPVCHKLSGEVCSRG